MRRAVRFGAGIALVAVGCGALAATPARGASAAAPAAAAPTPVEFMGAFETGTTYVAEMAYDARALHTWRPVREVRVAKNVAWTIDWTNIDKFPQLKTPAVRGRPQLFRFRVAKNDVTSGSPVLPWMSTYRCEILAVEPVGAAGPSKAASKKR